MRLTLAMGFIPAAACLAILPVAALAQQAPSQAQLQETAAKKIGPYWTSTAFQIVSKAFKQDPLKPTFVARFQMNATNPAALYLPNGDKIGPEEVLVTTVPAKTARTFYGTVDLTYAAGSWAGPTTIENPPNKLGKPIDFYTVPTLVLGSDQYKQAVAQQTAFSINERKAQFQKQLDAVQKADAAKVADIEKSFAGNLQNVNTSFADQLKQQQMSLTAELGGLLTKSREALADQQKKVEQAWTDLITQQQDELAKLKVGLQATRQAVEAKIHLAQATVDKQKKLMDLQQQALANNAAIAALDKKLAEKGQLASFEGTWGGTLRCDKKHNPWRIYATQVELTLSKKIGGMLSGQMTVTGGDTGLGSGYGHMDIDKPMPASLQIMNENAPGPVQMNILTGGKSRPERHFLNFEVQLDPSGVLKGGAVHALHGCSVIFSR